MWFRGVASPGVGQDGRMGILRERRGAVEVLTIDRPEKRNALDRWAAELMRAVDGKPAGKVVSIRPGK